MSYLVECPYCEEENKIEHEGEVEFDFECDHCGEEFEVKVEYDPIFTASKIRYETCRDCGKKYRHEGKSFPKPSKYDGMDLKDYIICNKCYCRETLKDMEKQ